MKYVYAKSNNKFEISQFVVTNERTKEIALDNGYVEISDKDYEKLVNHELCWENGVLVPYTKTVEDLAEEKIAQAKEKFEQIAILKNELQKVMEDVEQEQLGIVRDDYAAKRSRAAEIINELRVLEGKTPRQIVETAEEPNNDN